MNIKYARHYKETLKVGDVCIFQRDKNGHSCGIRSKIGLKCVIKNINYSTLLGKNLYYVIFNGEHYPDLVSRENLVSVEEYNKKREEYNKKREELKLKMKDIDPYEEEDWMIENINESLNKKNIQIGDILVHPVFGEGVVLQTRSDRMIFKIKFKDKERDINIDVVSPEMYKKGRDKKEKDQIKWYKKGKLYKEEDWTNESINDDQLKVGDICTLINGRDIGIGGRDGEKCTIIRIVSDIINGLEKIIYYIKFPGTNFEYYCYREHLIPINIDPEIEKKRKEMNKKMIDVDPYEEEDWLSERKIAYKKKLCPVLWEDGEIKERIRLKLMRIANDFFNDMELDVELLDVYLTGSIANYNYNADSDIDVHLIIDYSEINEDVELVEKAVDGERYVWNLRHNIVIQEHDVELYVQDINAKHASSGVYSLMKNEWVKKPVYNRPNMDQVDVDNKYDIRVKDILRFEKISKEDLTPDEAEEYYKSARQLKKRIQKDRTDGLNIIGEFSLENLVFKKLRKTGKFGKLIDAITRLYDKIYSQ